MLPLVVFHCSARSLGAHKICDRNWFCAPVSARCTTKAVHSSEIIFFNEQRSSKVNTIPRNESFLGAWTRSGENKLVPHDDQHVYMEWFLDGKRHYLPVRVHEELVGSRFAHVFGDQMSLFYLGRWGYRLLIISSINSTGYRKRGSYPR